MHRMADVLMHFEGKRQDQQQIVKNMKSMTITRGGHIIGQSFFGKWEFTSLGNEYYTEEQRKQAEEWASQE